jgi:hypothetical protein
MIYSRFFHTESEATITRDLGDYRYIVLSTPQSHTPSLGFRKSVGLQLLAVIWEGESNLRIISLIEEALVARVLSPVKLLYVENERLEIIVDQDLNDEKLKAFVHMWNNLMWKIFKTKMSFLVFTENQESLTANSSRAVAMYAQETLKAAGLGIQDYSPKFSLLGEILLADPQ